MVWTSARNSMIAYWAWYPSWDNRPMMMRSNDSFKQQK
jgi:hypothetical protein